MKCPTCGIEHIEPIHLAPRLTECLIYLAKGFSIEECAEKMNVTRNTVMDSRRRIYSQLNVGSVAEASAIAVKMRLPV